MTRPVAILLRALAVGAGLCLLLTVSAVLIIRSDWFADQVKRRIVAEVEKVTGGKAEIGAFSFDWWRLQAEVKPFVLRGRERSGEPPLFQAASIRVGLRVISALRRDINIASLIVSQPRVRVLVYPDGTTNLPQPEVARIGRHPVEELLSLAIGDFRVEGGRIEVAERRIPLDTRCEDLSVHLVYESAAPRYSGEVSFRELQLGSTAVAPLAIAASVSLAIETNRVLIRSSRLSTEKSSVEANGTIDNLLSPRASLSFDAKLSLAELQAAAKLPATVQGVMSLTGKLAYAGPSDYEVISRVSGSGLSLRVPGGTARNIRIASRLEARPGRAELLDLNLSALGGSFSGQADWRESGGFHLSGNLKEASLVEVARLRGIEGAAWSGSVSGPLEVAGVLRGSGVSGVKAGAKLSVVAAAGGQPVSGLVDASFDQAAGTLDLGDSYLATPTSRVRFKGALERNLQVEAESTDLNDVLRIASLFSAGLPHSIPFALKGGSAKFSGAIQGKLDDPRASGHLTVSRVVYQGRLIDRLESDITVGRSSLQASNFAVDQGPARLRGNVRVQLSDWKPIETGRLEGAISLGGLSVEEELARTGEKVPVRGVLSGSFQLAGTIGSPVVTGKAALAQAEVLGRRVDQAVAQVRYGDRSFSLESLQLASGAARLQGNAAYSYHLNDVRSGDVRFEVSSTAIPLEDLKGVAGVPEAVDGTLALQLRGTLAVSNSKPLLTGLSGNVSLRGLAVGKRPMGNLKLAIETQNGAVTLALNGAMAGSQLSGKLTCSLKENNPMQGEIGFKGLSLSAVWPWLTPLTKGARRPLEATAEGKVTFGGAALMPAAWNARIEMSTLEILPLQELKAQGLGLRSVGPVVVTVSQKEIRFESVRFAGPETSIEASGRIGLAAGNNMYDLRIQGGLNLAVLQIFEPNLTSAGESTLDANIRGSLANPELYGRLELKNGSFYLSGVPNGINNANGVISLSRDRATINNVTAETGGGKLTLNGFAGFGGGRPTYGLQAVAQQVRVRYPAGVSTTLDATLLLSGTAGRSVLSGKVTLLRSALTQEVLATLTAHSSQPLASPAAENELLRGMQLNIRVESSPNARFETSLTRDIQAEADLQLRGTPYKPILLGRFTINHGETELFGTRYTITRGEISFLNPIRLEPVLNLDMQTRVRGIDVTMNYSGPWTAAKGDLSLGPSAPAQRNRRASSGGRYPHVRHVAASRAVGTASEFAHDGGEQHHRAGAGGAVHGQASAALWGQPYPDQSQDLRPGKQPRGPAHYRAAHFR